MRLLSCFQQGKHTYWKDLSGKLACGCLKKVKKSTEKTLSYGPSVACNTKALVLTALRFLCSGT